MALSCNIVVVLSSVIILYRSGKYKGVKAWPLILLSIPMAYLGGKMQLSQEIFFNLLGATLILVAIVMLKPIELKKLAIPKYGELAIGGGIGFLSGLVGIGGGIFLSPILHLSKWSRAISIAACTALFILVNSIAGLIGQLNSSVFVFKIEYLLLILAVTIGGQIGIRLSLSKFTTKTIRTISAILIFIVGIRLVYKYLILNWLV